MKILLTVLILIVLIIVSGYFKVKKKKKKLEQAQQNALFKAYGSSDLIKPKLKYNTSYSFPEYNLRFHSKDDLEYAELNNLNKVFIQEVQKIHSDHSGFDAEKAVFFSCE